MHFNEGNISPSGNICIKYFYLQFISVALLFLTNFNCGWLVSFPRHQNRVAGLQQSENYFFLSLLVLSEAKVTHRNLVPMDKLSHIFYGDMANLVLCNSHGETSIDLVGNSSHSLNEISLRLGILINCIIQSWALYLDKNTFYCCAVLVAPSFSNNYSLQKTSESSCATLVIGKLFLSFFSLLCWVKLELLIETYFRWKH